MDSSDLCFRGNQTVLLSDYIILDISFDLQNMRRLLSEDSSEDAEEQEHRSNHNTDGESEDSVQVQ